MESSFRSKFNADFTSEKYAALLRCVNETEKWPADFRISETPIFLTREFTDEVTRAAYAIVDQTRTSEFARHTENAIPEGLEVPNESAHSNFLVVDFGICAEGDRLVPRLIELQAFPSLFGFQLLLLHCIRKAYPVIPRNWTSSFDGIKDEAYIELLRRTIVADVDPENVVLLELKPEKQKTRIDFAATETLLHIRPVLNLPFQFQDDLDVTWVGHPNWYFRISKHSLPFLKTQHTTPAFFANEFPAGEKIDNYVLKPLYSFAGLGVDMEPTREKVGALKNPQEWILQKKINYAAFVPTVDGLRSKAEIRMMFVWPENDRDPILVNNLVRMSQGKMMGVDFNIDNTWVGASIALHE